jgi:hypothetical protein
VQAAGKKAEEIAAELGISVPSVYRILARGRSDEGFERAQPGKSKSC